jgi:predicted dehydrogenase
MGLEYNRRKFLKSGLLATGGVVLASSYLEATPLFFGDRKVRIGVIGVGDRGSGLSSLIDEIEGLEVVAYADLIPFRLEAALAKNARAKGYESHIGLLNDPNVDAVLITTPFSTHDEIAIAAMNAGKHIYCEKTMVKGLDEMQTVIDLANQTGLVFQTGHQYHSSLLYRKVREIIRSGYIGDVTSYECQWNRNGSWRRPVPDPKWERIINWRMYREYSGGLIAELMSHQIDFINWVTDSHPAKITGFGGIDHFKDGRETFDNVHLLFEYPSGLDASFTCTTTNGYEDYQIKILGSKATIIMDYTHAEIYSEKKGLRKELGVVDGVSGATMQAWEQGKGAPIDAPGNDPTLDALRQFYDSIVNNAPVVSDIKTGAITSKCVHIGLEAVHQGGVKYWKDYPELRFS